MKVNKLKTLLYCLGASTLLTTLSVDATSLSVAKINNDSNTKAVYEVYLEPTEEVSNITIKFKSSDTNVKPEIRKADNVEAVCDNHEYCAITGKYSSKLKIAEVTLENTTEAQIDNLTLSVSSEGIGNVSSEPISLQGKEVITTKAKSTNAELSNLTVSVGTMSPAFNASERSYTINGIKDTVNSITFTPTCDNCVTEFTCIENCSISENKNNRIMLEEGANTIRMTSKSEDGNSTLEYNFTVYRGEVKEPSAYLKDLKIEGVELDTKFDTMQNEYSATVDLDVEKLEINYELEDPEAKVEIKGNNKLKEGENTVTITVTRVGDDGKEHIQVYTITVNKEDICDPEKEECEEKEVKETVSIEKKKTNKVWLIISLVTGALAIIGISGFIIFKKKKKNKNKDDKNNKNGKNGKSEKIKNMIIDPEEVEETTLEEDLLNEETVNNAKKEDIIKPRIKPSVDEALEDLMKTKEIELSNL